MRCDGGCEGVSRGFACWREWRALVPGRWMARTTSASRPQHARLCRKRPKARQDGRAAAPARRRGADFRVLHSWRTAPAGNGLGPVPVSATLSIRSEVLREQPGRPPSRPPTADKTPVTDGPSPAPPKWSTTRLSPRTERRPGRRSAAPTLNGKKAAEKRPIAA